MSAEVLVRREGALLRVTVNRPEKRNPLSRAVLARLREFFEEHGRDDRLSAAVLSGTGDRSFAAGGDLRDRDRVRSLDEALGWGVPLPHDVALAHLGMRHVTPDAERFAITDWWPGDEEADCRRLRVRDALPVMLNAADRVRFLGSRATPQRSLGLPRIAPLRPSHG